MYRPDDSPVSDSQMQTVAITHLKNDYSQIMGIGHFIMNPLPNVHKNNLYIHQCVSLKSCWPDFDQT
jgi:hypothetical protein